MSDAKFGKGARAPKLNVEQGNADEVFEEDQVVEPEDGDAAEFQEAVGFLKGAGMAAWRYAVKHPHTAVGAVAGFVFAVLVLTLGLWSTIIIAIFVLAGALIGQIRDGDNSIVNFFGRLFSGKH